jgi:EEF1A lysine methyltransferase 1
MLQFDKKFEKTNPEAFVFYDYKHPEDIPAELHGTFDYVIVDPPFIVREVWELYTQAIKILLKAEGGKMLCSTIMENKAMMDELLQVHPVAFLPSIPNLVYQYNFYANYESEGLTEKNPEIPE